jgi:5'-phosphate synthase pdxT subunit
VEESSSVIGVLAVQGDVQEHLDALRRAGADVGPVRTPEEIAASDGLVIPGGESTTIGKLMARYGLLEPIRALVADGKPLLGTCAGMIVMAKRIGCAANDQPALGLMDITVQRNAFGRQVDSFEADLDFQGVDGGPVRAVFIRAPVITDTGDGVKVLATCEGRIVAARQGSMLALAFHPELTEDVRVQRYFLGMR